MSDLELSIVWCAYGLIGAFTMRDQLRRYDFIHATAASTIFSALLAATLWPAVWACESLGIFHSMGLPQSKKYCEHEI